MVLIAIAIHLEGTSYGTFWINLTAIRIISLVLVRLFVFNCCFFVVPVVVNDYHNDEESISGWSFFYYTNEYNTTRKYVGANRGRREGQVSDFA